MADDISGLRVLVTGAGGWLGGEIAARLARQGAAVTGLVRRPGPVLGNDGERVPVARMLSGDVAVPRFGWDAATWQAEARGHDLVVHCAALTQFDADPALAHRVNVGGTREAAAFVAAGGSRLLHVSTAYVNGTRDGVVREAPVGAAEGNNAYERTKAEAEAVVREAGVPAVIVRPSIVLGDSATGRVRQFGTFYYLLKLFAEGRVSAMPAAPGATLNLVPVDHVAAGMVALIRRFPAASGGIFHLVAGVPTPLSAFGETFARFPGLRTPAFVPPDRFELPPGRFFPRLVAPYAPYFQRDPRFADDGFRRVTGSGCDLDYGLWWRRLVAFALEAGFVQASRVGRKGMAREGAMPSSAGSR